MARIELYFTKLLFFRQWIGGDESNQYLWWNSKNAKQSWMETKVVSEVKNKWWNRYCVKLNIIPLSENAGVSLSETVNYVLT